MKRLIVVLMIIFMFSMLANADGFIITPKPVRITDSPFPLAVNYHRVNVQINDLLATVNIDQEFYNPQNYSVEGYYFFPIPKNAVIKTFSMYINGKEVESELLDASKASQIYQNIVDRLKDPAILEYSGQGLFKVKIYPIEAHSTKRVKISYTQVLIKDNGTVEFVYPLNTEKFSSKKLKEITITTTVKSSNTIKNIFSTTHDIDTVYHSKNNVTASYEDENTLPDTDFKLYYSINNDKLGISLLTYRQNGENGFFLMNVDPGHTQQKGNIEPKELVFILDTSGSMKGDKLQKAKESLTFCINNLNEKDTFNVIRFSTDAEALFNSPQGNSRQNRKKAIQFIKTFRPIGGTNINDAFNLAFAKSKKSSLTKMVIFITDGKPTIGETNIDKLLKRIKKLNSNNSRVFTFGIGYEINTLFLDNLAQMSNGFRTYIQPNENIKQKIANFFLKVNSPVMTNIKISVANKVGLLQIYPQKMPDLFYGSSLTLIGRYKGYGEAALVVEGLVKNKRIKYSYKLNFPKEDIDQDSLAALWATRRIGYLLDQIRLNGENSELVNEITVLSRKYGIITPYTSYLIVEDEMSTNNSEKYNTLSSITKKDRKYQKRNKKKYDNMQQDSGEEGVISSEKIQQMRDTKSYSKVKEYDEEQFYTDEKGQNQQVRSQVKLVQGRAFYYNGNFWIDSLLQKSKHITKINQIKFGSKKYFGLINQEPQLAKILALGKNIRFLYNEKIFEIYE